MTNGKARPSIKAAMLLAGAVALSGCASGGEPSPDADSPGAPPAATVTASPDGSPLPDGISRPSMPPEADPGPDSPPEADDAETPTDPSPKSGDGTATAQQPAHIADVRVGRHQTYDRVVIDFSAGDPLPDYEVAWLPAGKHLAAPGSGLPVQIDGDRVLEVTLHGARNRGPETSRTDYPVVRQVYSFGSFEAVALMGVGAATGSEDELGFRVSSIEKGPPRLVIDIAHPGA